MADTEGVKIALDWTPNGNHCGIFVALAKNFYKDEGLDNVEIISPHQDQYQETPASKVSDGGKGTWVGIAPKETIVSSHPACRSDGRQELVAVAALLQEDDSAIVTLKESGIDSMSKLEGKRYASYGARYEGRIVKKMIQNAGGSGEYQELTPNKLGLWDAVVHGNCDATWVFMGWEGQEAKMKGLELNVFRLKDHGIPYGYPLVVFTTKKNVEDENAKICIHKFLKATAKGYKWTVENQEEAARIFAHELEVMFPEVEQNKDLVRASVQACSETFCTTEGAWGRQRDSVWGEYLDWLSENGLLTTKIQSTNPKQNHQTTLDGLRGSDAGETIARHSISADDLYTNALL